MTKKTSVTVLFMSMLATAGLAVRFTYGACTWGCYEFDSWREDGKKWVDANSEHDPQVIGNARNVYASPPQGTPDGMQQTCYKKETTGCTEVCSNCPGQQHPNGACQLDNCNAGIGNFAAYECWESCNE